MFYIEHLSFVLELTPVILICMFFSSALYVTLLKQKVMDDLGLLRLSRQCNQLD